MQNSKLEIQNANQISRALTSAATSSAATSSAATPRSYERGHSSTMTADEMAETLVAAARSGDGLLNAKEYTSTLLRRWEQEIRRDEIGRQAYAIQNGQGHQSIA